MHNLLLLFFKKILCFFTECTSDKIGTDECNRRTGDSRCKPNVIGENCDRCAVSGKY